MNWVIFWWPNGLASKLKSFLWDLDQSCLAFRYGETEYLISAFPLGGYVKMFGEGGFSEIEMIEQEYERETPGCSAG
jgi:regulator of sigma E protease